MNPALLGASEARHDLPARAFAAPLGTPGARLRRSSEYLRWSLAAGGDWRGRFRERGAAQGRARRAQRASSS